MGSKKSKPTITIEAESEEFEQTVKSLAENHDSIISIQKNGLYKYYVGKLNFIDNSYSIESYHKKIWLESVDNQKKIQEEECAICLEPMEKNAVKLSVCNHYFHKKCIEQYFKVNEACPLCRAAPNVPQHIYDRFHKAESDTSSVSSYDEYDDY